MMNTNQYLAIIILINLSAGMVLSTMYSNQTISDYDQNKLNTMSQLPEDVQAAQDDSSYLAGDNEYDKTPGNIFTMGKLVWDTLVWGFTPFPIISVEKTTFEKAILTPIILLQVLMYIFTFILIYDKIKNKKVD